VLTGRHAVAAWQFAEPGFAGPGSVAPGSAAPGSAAPGSAAPGSAAPGSAAPGSAAPGSAAPGSAAPGLAGPASRADGATADPASAPRLTENGLPVRVRQQSLAPQLRGSGPAPVAAPDDAPSPEATRSAMSAFWQGRTRALSDADQGPGPDLPTGMEGR
jgi:hypothetical protein